jgi:spermidine synthase
MTNDNGYEWWSESDFGIGVRTGIKARLLHEGSTKFQEMRIFEHPLMGKVLVLDDIIQTTTTDEFFYHEMFVRVPIVGHPRFNESDRKLDVLIIGGGDGGILREVLRYRQVQRVTMVEIDGEVIDFCNEHLGFQGDYDDPRVELIIGDGAAYVAKAATETFDHCIVDSTDPGGPSMVLYTPEFHEQVRGLLKPDGSMVRHMGIGFHHHATYRPILTEIRDIFPSLQVYRNNVPAYVGGDMAFACATKDGHRVDEPQSEDPGRYYNAEIHRASFAMSEWWKLHYLPPTKS